MKLSWTLTLTLLSTHLCVASRLGANRSRKLDELTVLVGIVGSVSTPLLKCQGDCDDDSECSGDLKCLQRDGDEPVPGCTGVTAARYAIDFCYDPNDASTFVPAWSQNDVSTTSGLTFNQWLAGYGDATVPPIGDQGGTWTTSLEVVVAEGSTPTRLLQKCEGDCNSNAECEGGLVCFERSVNEQIPGCIGDLLSLSGVDFCYDPSDATDSVGPSPTSTPVVNTPPPPNDFPGSSMLVDVGNGMQGLGRCEGDCDSDNDCVGAMKCYQRNGEMTSVPGCMGSGTQGTDYCIDPMDDPSDYNKDTFRLKLFWREGYYWQEERFERKWCMRCEGNVCDRNDKIRVYTCDDTNTKFRFINQSGGETQIQIDGTNLCLEADAGFEEWTRIQDCDDSKASQRFKPGEGDFNGDRFELVPVVMDGCLTQRHHPKSGEAIYTETCETARRDTTSFWNKY